MLAKLTSLGSKLLGSIQIWKWPPFITFGSTAYGVRGDAQRTVLDTIQSGDLVLRRYNHYITSLAIPGYYSHVGIARTKTKIIHALHRGVVEEDILTFSRTDHLLILRPRDQSTRSRAVGRAVAVLGRPYDFKFDTVNKAALYCTEVALYCYSELVPDRTEMKPRVEPDALLELEAFEVIFDSREDKK